MATPISAETAQVSATLDLHHHFYFYFYFFSLFSSREQREPRDAPLGAARRGLGGASRNGTGQAVGGCSTSRSHRTPSAAPRGGWDAGAGTSEARRSPASRARPRPGGAGRRGASRAARARAAAEGSAFGCAARAGAAPGACGRGATARSGIRRPAPSVGFRAGPAAIFSQPARARRPRGSALRPARRWTGESAAGDEGARRVGGGEPGPAAGASVPSAGGALGRAQRRARGAVLPPGRVVGLAGEEEQRRREPGAQIFCFQEPAGSPQAASPPRVEGCLCARWRRAGRATEGEVLRESGGSRDPPSWPGARRAGAPHEASFPWDPERGLVAVAFISVNTTSSRSQVSN